MFDCMSVFTAQLSRVLSRGSMTWRRSKILLVGPGRAGKTALARSLLGKEFVQTDSTIGVEQFGCYVDHVNVLKSWVETQKSGSSFLSAVAQELYESSSVTSALKVSLSCNADSCHSGLTADFSGATLVSTANVSDVSILSNLDGSPVRKNLVEASKEISHAFHLPYSFQQVVTDEKEDKQMLEFLGTFEHSSSDMTISLFDFGGQAVFDIVHNFFLTKNGVYVLVFDMMLMNNPSERVACIAGLKHWLNSIVLHTTERNRVAPIVLVGTRKDLVYMTNITNPNHTAIILCGGCT